MSRGIGVDACPYGWCVTKLDGDSISIDIVEQFAEILVAHPDTPILVDIPIVLPTTSRRRCDEGAKDILGCRGGSVFYTICEAAISIDDYDEAKKVHKNNIGHGLSQQAFSIGRKIRQV
jgi:predicted RNase H-like nuclease